MQKKLGTKLWIIILLSVALKMVLFLWFYTGNLAQITQPDSVSYSTPAEWLLRTGHFYASANNFMFFRTPGYPCFLASIFWIFGHHYSMVILAQISLSAILILTSYKIVERLFSPRAGLIAALLAAMDYLALGYSYLILSDFLFAVALSLGLLAGTYILTTPKVKYSNFLFLGLAVAVATTIRPINYFLIFVLIPIFAGYLWQQMEHKSRIILALGVLLLPSIILVGGWQIRNNILFHSYRFSEITDQSGMRVFFSEGFQNYITTHRITKDQSIGIKQDIAIVLQNPLSTVKQFSLGLTRLLLETDRALIQFFGSQNDIAVFRKIKQFLIQFKFRLALTEYQEHTFNWFTSLYLLVALSCNIILYALLGVSLYGGLKQKLLQPKAAVHFFLLICVGYFILLSSNAVTNARFRLPFEIILDIYAAIGLSLIISWLTLPKTKFQSPISGLLERSGS